MSNTTSLSIRPPRVSGEPSAYLNPGSKSGEPFAVVDLGDAWLYIHDPGHARAIAAAFTKAADLLETDAAAARDGGQP